MVSRATQIVAERSRRPKTGMALEEEEERLSSISILSIEKDRIKNIDLNNIVNTFAKNHNNKRILLL